MGVARGVMAVVPYYFAAAVSLPVAAQTAATVATLPAAAPRRTRLLPPQPPQSPASPLPLSLAPAISLPLHAAPYGSPHAPPHAPPLPLPPPLLPRLVSRRGSPCLLPHRVDVSGRRSFFSFLGDVVFFTRSRCSLFRVSAEDAKYVPCLLQYT